MVRNRESLGSRSARTFSVLTVARIVALLIGIASLVIIARLLGPHFYGIYTVAFAFFALIGGTNNFGFGSYLTKYLAEYEDKKDAKNFGRVLSSAFLGVILVGILLTLFGIAISGAVAYALAGSGITTIDLMFASSILFFFMLYGTADHALIGAGMNTAAALLENSENVVLIVASVLFILLGRGVDGAIAGILVSYIFASIVGTYQIFWFAHKRMHAKIGWPSLAAIKHAFNFSIPVAVNNLLSNAMINIATLFLGFFVAATAIGNFGVAKNARNVLAVFYGTAAVTLLPTLTLAASRAAEKAREGRFEYVYNKALLYSVIATVPIIVYIGAYATPLVYLLVGKSFSSAPVYLALVALGTIVGLAGVYVTSLFVARGKTRQLLTYSAISAGAQVIALALLVPTQGVLGAIIAIFFVGSALTSYLFLRGARKVLGVKTHYGKLIRSFAGNAALAAVFAVALLQNSFIVDIIYGLLALIIVYPFLLVVSGSIDEGDLALFKKAVGHFSALRKSFGPLLAYFEFLLNRF